MVVFMARTRDLQATGDIYTWTRPRNSDEKEYENLIIINVELIFLNLSSPLYNLIGLKN